MRLPKILVLTWMIATKTRVFGATPAACSHGGPEGGHVSKRGPCHPQDTAPGGERWRLGVGRIDKDSLARLSSWPHLRLNHQSGYSFDRTSIHRPSKGYPVKGACRV